MILAANQMQICIWSPPIAMITCVLSQISVWAAKRSHFKSRSVKRGLKAARVCQQVRRGTCLMACQSGLLACPLGKSGKFCDRSLRSKLGPANRDFFGQITHLVAFLEGRSLNNVTLYCVGNQSFGHLAIQFRGIRSKLIYKLNCFTFDKLTHLFKVKLISLVGKKRGCPMWAMRSPRGSVRWCKSCRECWSCDHVDDNTGCWTMAMYWVGDDCHWDGGGRVGRQGGVQGGKDGQLQRLFKL